MATYMRILWDFLCSGLRNFLSSKNAIPNPIVADIKLQNNALARSNCTDYLLDEVKEPIT